MTLMRRLFPPLFLLAFASLACGAGPLVVAAPRDGEDLAEEEPEDTATEDSGEIENEEASDEDVGQAPVDEDSVKESTSCSSFGGLDAGIWIMLSVFLLVARKEH